MSRFVQFEGLVCFFCGNISISNGSSASHSESVRLLEYGIIITLESLYDLNSSWEKMSNGFYTDKPKPKVVSPSYNQNIPTHDSL